MPIDQAVLTELLALKDQPRLSLYMPTVEAGVETRQNAIRLKNLMRQAETELLERGVPAPTVRELLKPASGMQRDRSYWQQQGRGLALFMAPDFVRDLRLPFEVPELISVGERFHLKPLLPYTTGDHRYYLLALDLEQIRLYQANQFEIERISIEDVPTAAEEGLRFDDPESQLQFHTSTAAPGGKRPAQFFGQAAEVKDGLLRYFHKVDRSLQQYLADKNRPLVMVGIGYSLPIYRQANSYPHLMERGIDRNPEGMSPNELRDAAWELIAEQLSDQRQHAAQAFGDLMPKQQAFNEVEQVVAAAHAGAVDTLFLARNRQVWGSYDTEAQQAQIHVRRQPGDSDLLDLAAVQVWKNDGDIHLVEAEQVPGEGPVAATLRFPMGG